MAIKIPTEETEAPAAEPEVPEAETPAEAPAETEPEAGASPPAKQQTGGVLASRSLTTRLIGWSGSS